MPEDFRLSSPRLSLVFPTERPFPALMTAAECDQFVRRLGFRPSRSLAGMRRHLAVAQADWRADERYTFDAWDAANDQFVGRVRISANDGGSCGLGYFVIPRFWQQGYGLEMASSALDLAFDTLDADIVEAGVAADNGASLALLERLGMRQADGEEETSRPSRVRQLILHREEWTRFRGERSPL